VTGTDLVRAFKKAVKRVSNDGILGGQTVAGHIIPTGQKRGQRKGVMVVVGAYWWDETLLKSHPGTDGLMIFAPPKEK